MPYIPDAVQRRDSIYNSNQWLEINLIEFRRELNKRNLCINYDIEDLESDKSVSDEAIGL
jgi:predicted HTH domain antitoxin